MIAWRLKYQSAVSLRTVFVTLAVNPLGAVSLFAGDSHYYGSIGDDVINSIKRHVGINGAVIEGTEFENSTGTPLKWVNDILSAVIIGQNEWTADLFDLQDRIIFYDLTNAYFEGRKGDSKTQKMVTSSMNTKDCKFISIKKAANPMFKSKRYIRP